MKRGTEATWYNCNRMKGRYASLPDSIFFSYNIMMKGLSREDGSFFMGLKNSYYKYILDT